MSTKRMKIKQLSFYLLLIVVSSLPLFLSSYFFFLKDPPIWPDEPIFLEMSQGLSTTGQTVSDLYGLTETVTTGLGYPPFYFYVLGNWLKVFDPSIESMRALSFVLALLTIGVFLAIARNLVKSTPLAVLGAFFLAANVHFSRFSHIARMEMLVLFLVLVTWLFFLLAQKKQKNYYYLFAGISAGLASITHPVGLIAPFVPILCLLLISQPLKKKIFQGLLIAIPVLFIVSLWVLNTSENLSFLLSAFNSHLQGKGSKVPFMFLIFQSDFSWRWLIILYTAVFLLFSLLVLKSRERSAQFVLVGLIVSTVVTTVGKEGGYFLYIQPFLILALLFLLKRFKGISIFLSILIFLNYLNIQYLNNDNIGITNNKSRSVFASLSFDYHDFGKRLIEYLPQNKEVSVFIAATPDPYFQLIKTGRFKVLEAADPDFPITDEHYKKALDSVDYIILTWIPHRFLSDYINRNMAENAVVGQQSGYKAIVIKLKPQAERK